MPVLKNERSALFLIIIFVIVTATSLVIAFSLKTDPVDEVLHNDQMLKILVVLGDSQKVYSTGVILYYPVSRRAAMIDIPGNTGSIYASLSRVDRIDAVYMEKGIDVYKAEIEKLIGTTIPFSVEMNLQQFSAAADIVGGIRVFIPSPVDTESDGVRYLLPSGSVVLDGDKIKTFLQYSSQYDTAEDLLERRQAAVLGFLSSFNKKYSGEFPKEIYLFLKKYMISDIDSDGLYRLLTEISAIDAERLVPQSVTGSLREVDGKLLLFPYYDGQLIKDVCRQTMSGLVASGDTVYSRTYVLEIQNGTPVQGLARNTAALLQSVGYEVLSMVNADTADYEKTLIIDHIGNEDVVKSLGEFIRCTNFITDEVRRDEEGLQAGSLVDFTIVLGKDFDGRYVRD